MSRDEDIAAAEAVAKDVGDAVDEVQLIYLVGSRAKGTADENSDFDLVAIVDGSLRALSPNWLAKGTVPAAGFATMCRAMPIHWCVLSADEFERTDLERAADFRASPIQIVYERDRACASRRYPGAYLG